MHPRDDRGPDRARAAWRCDGRCPGGWRRARTGRPGTGRTVEERSYPRYVAHQAYYSLLNRDYEWDLMPLGLDQGVGAVVWSPLGWGKLTGKIRRGQPGKPGSRAHDIAGTGPQYEE